MFPWYPLFQVKREKYIAYQFKAIFFNNLRIMHIINFNISVIFIKVIQTMCVLKIAIMKYDALGKKHDAEEKVINHEY